MNSKKVFFELIKTHKDARLGQIRTSRGLIDTPAVLPVGTQGTVKSIFVDDVLKIALTKEFKRVEWVEVDSLSKTKDKSEKVLTN